MSGRGDKGVLVSCSHGSFNKDGVKSDLFMNSCHDSRNLTGQITEDVKLYIYSKKKRGCVGKLYLDIV